MPDPAFPFSLFFLTFVTKQRGKERLCRSVLSPARSSEASLVDNTCAAAAAPGCICRWNTRVLLFYLIPLPLSTYRATLHKPACLLQAPDLEQQPEGLGDMSISERWFRSPDESQREDGNETQE